MKPLVGLSLMHEQEFLNAAIPLFLKNEVDVLEWSFDTILVEKYKPEWVHQLLKEYSINNRLIGHGVRYSLFDAKWTKRQESWIRKLKAEVKRYNYNHITEHFGFMSHSDFHKGAPLPVPFNKKSLAIGTDRLKRLQHAAELPVGVENLAFAFSKHEINKQGEFLDSLVESVNGFLILDLHNLYCQSQNFKTAIIELVKSYPLKKVKEIHISGGSWQNSVYTKDIKKVRRDTHDEKVPAEIFKVLPEVMKLCPNVEYVIFERLGDTLHNEKEAEDFRKDFRRLRKIIAGINSSKKTQTQNQKPSAAKGLPTARPITNNQKLNPPLFDQPLYNEQQFILDVLRKSQRPSEAFSLLKQKQLPDWNIASWNTSMLETAIGLIRKWDL
ncbi:MAG: hypothetical protein K0S32_3207 [Bacteroidetes bacterium]|jgi:uncharacterized protein (UPF0276 family)|nr:hypothetical protein [Bacteroidota bacterium]